MDISTLKIWTNLGNPESNFDIIEDTDDFVLVYKYHGIAVQATDDHVQDLEIILNKKYDQKVFVLNRIDQPVTGLVIFGKNKAFSTAFTEMLKERTVKKTYLAIVAGTPENKPTTLCHYIKKLHNRAISADEKVDEKFKEAVLEYQLLQSFDNYSLLKVNLKTGRFHQIRVQLATMGMPIKGDLKYGSKRPNLDKSICLLSYQLEFIHPFTGKNYSYRAKLPENDPLWKHVHPESLLR